MSLTKVITEFVHTRIAPPPGVSKGAPSTLLPDGAPDMPVNDARQQFILDELRKVEGQ